MTPRRPLPAFLLALVVSLLSAAPALAGGLVRVDGTQLVFTGDASEPSNVTISQGGGALRLSELASRMSAGAGCTASADGFRVSCPDAGVERISVTTSDFGSDVRIRAALPADIHGGAGDDVLIGGPAADTIDGGGGQDVIGGGPGADVLRGGPGVDLVTYADRIASDGTLLPRAGGVRVAIGRPGFSGAGGEHDTIARDVEQLQGGAGSDRFELRDGLGTSIACGNGRDIVIADPRDDEAIDCEATLVAPARGSGTRIAIPSLAFPFTGRADRARSEVRVEPLLRLRHGVALLHVSCPAGVGLLEVDGPGCSGQVRFAHGGVSMGARRVSLRRGRTITMTVPLSSSRALARRAGGLAITATALPDRGHVHRLLRFSVRG